MRLLAEIYPFVKEHNLKSEIENMEGFDGFNIPDNPLGYPKIPPILIGYMIREKYFKKDIIINQALNSVGELYVHSIIKAAKMIKSSIVFTMGDEPKYGKRLNEISSETAASIAAESNVNAGLIISFSYSYAKIKERMKSNASFYLALNLKKPEMLENLDASKIIPYIIIKTERNSETIGSIKQPYINENSLKDYCDALESYGIKAVILSTPGDKRGS
ncbi:hypothetical protein [Acidiplasma cupricumulans]|uniref:hypothetical protein n=1 Tax=Acidiplasma cupricumulans TaxID=312540 RepID=UPI0007815C5E|nr:hypothetical protein [Acidiplasma cupricumulans]